MAAEKPLLVITNRVKYLKKRIERAGLELRNAARAARISRRGLKGQHSRYKT